MGYGRISGTGMEPHPHRVNRNAPPRLVGLHPPRVSLSLRAAPPIDDKPMQTDNCHTVMRDFVDPREKSVIVPGLSGFSNGHETLSSRGGAALMSEPQTISRKRIWLGFHAMRGGVDTGGHRYFSNFLEL